MNRKEKVLVIGDDTRSFLATVRSLGRKGIDVHVAPFNLTSPAIVSRYIKAIHRLPYYVDGGVLWLGQFRSLLETERFDLVIPCDERALLPMVLHQKELTPLARLAIPNELGMEYFFDKHKTRELAARVGVPIANGRLLESIDEVDFVLSEISLPVNVKSRKSYCFPDLYVRTEPKIVRSEAELKKYVSRRDLTVTGLLTEQVFSGFGVGVSVLCDRGEVLQAFEHHRMREIGGTSYYRKSADLHLGRLNAVSKMVRAIDYTGIALFEFKVHERSGSWVLLEVNARPWGSMPLPISLGIDFPYGLYKLLVKGERTTAVAYKTNVFGRNLVPDLRQMRSMWNESSLGSKSKLMFAAGKLREISRVLYGREHLDVCVPDDPMPGMVEYARFVQNVGLSLWRKASGRNSLKRRFNCKSFERAILHQKQIEIMLLCQGNTCRSPYAAQRLRQLIGGYPGIVISSFGILPRNARSSPTNAVKAAAIRGIDLADHRSRCLEESDLLNKTMVVVFDRINMSNYISRFPEYADKACFLGEFFDSSGPIIEVEDPEGKALEEFNDVYQQIDLAVGRLARLIKLIAFQRSPDVNLPPRGVDEKLLQDIVRRKL